MSDIVERLRGIENHSDLIEIANIRADARDAADEIERLRIRVVELGMRCGKIETANAPLDAWEAVNG